MEKYFTKYDMKIPNTVFWNMNSNTPGFPSLGNTKGLQLAEGLSHGMLTSILTNSCEYTSNKSNITPTDSFLKTICNSYYDKVTNNVHLMIESIFNNNENRVYSLNFIKKYQ